MSDSRRCAVCNAVIPSAAHKSRKYCGTKCAGRAQLSSEAHAEYLAKKREQKRAAWISHACGHCGESFLGPSKRVYCSRRCNMRASSQAARDRDPEGNRERRRERERRQRANPSVPQVCTGCGVEFLASRNRNRDRFCTPECRYSNIVIIRRPRSPKISPLREAVENRDFEKLIPLIRANVVVAQGCWIWQKQARKKSGKKMYPTTSWGVALHRAVCEAKYGAPLGSQHAHHTCGNSICVNPDHLVPVTDAENIAEMLARQSYINRIDDLETALARLDPDHPLLKVIPVSRKSSIS